MFSYNETTYDDLINQNSELIYLFRAIKGLNLNRINYSQINDPKSDIIMTIDIHLYASVELRYKYSITKSGNVISNSAQYKELTKVIEKWVNICVPKKRVYDAGVLYTLPVSRINSI
jgi:hypothetical protein